MPEILSALTLIEAGTPGIRKAFEYAPTLVSPLPAFVNFIEGGDYITPRMMGLREAEQRIRSVAAIALQADSSDAERIARKLVDDFVTRLDQHKTLDGTAGVLDANVVKWEYGPVSFQNNEQQFLGVSFEVSVRTIETVTFQSSG